MKLKKYKKPVGCLKFVFVFLMCFVSAIGCDNSTGLSVGGTVSGLEGVVVLQNNGGDDLEISEDGSFVFSENLASGDDYLISIATQPDTQNCVIANLSGTITDVAVTDIVVECQNFLRVFVTDSVEGNQITSRELADAFCAAQMPEDLICNTTTAFISYSADDQLRDLPTGHDMPDHLAFVGADDVVLATDFASLLSGSSAEVVSGLDESDLWWSFSNTTGEIASPCDGDENSFGNMGVGRLSADYISVGGSICTNELPVICLCY